MDCTTCWKTAHARGIPDVKLTVQRYQTVKNHNYLNFVKKIREFKENFRGLLAVGKYEQI